MPKQQLIQVTTNEPPDRLLMAVRRVHQTYVVLQSPDVCMTRPI